MTGHPQEHSSQLPEPLWYTDVALQVYKDFVSCGADILFPEDPGANWKHTLTLCILPVIQDLVRTDRAKLMKLVYRVDIPESRLGKALENLNPQQSAETLTQLIIEREEQKIRIRRSLS